METKESRQEQPMGSKRIEGRSAARQLALDITADQPAANIKSHKREDFLIKPPLTDEEFEEFMAAIEGLRKNSTGPRDPFKD